MGNLIINYLVWLNITQKSVSGMYYIKYLNKNTINIIHLKIGFLTYYFHILVNVSHVKPLET